MLIPKNQIFSVQPIRNAEAWRLRVEPKVDLDVHHSIDPHACVEVDGNGLTIEQWDGDLTLGDIQDIAAELLRFPIRHGAMFYEHDAMIEVSRGKGGIARHPILGAVFTLETDGAVTTYRRVDNDESAAQQILDGLSCGNNSVYTTALVRRKEELQWHYYPLHLIFATETERQQYAFTTRGIPPIRSWIEAKRREVLTALSWRIGN